MKLFRILTAAGILALSLVSVSSDAFAASAHNSQAGANGDTSNNSAPINR